MNCAIHADVPATAYCRECGKPMCDACRQLAHGSVYCAEHAPAAAPPPPPTMPMTNPSPYTVPPYTTPPYTTQPGAEIPVNPHGPVPAIAFGLGFIPGVGAIYNGQYAKGLIHAVVFGLLVSIADRAHGVLEPLVGIGVAVWVFYMAFEAYHTARKRRYGGEVEEFSSLFETGSGLGVGKTTRLPGGPLVLIALGVFLLLDTTGIISVDELDRFWPLGLIAIGLYLLFVRMYTPGTQK